MPLLTKEFPSASGLFHHASLLRLLRFLRLLNFFNPSEYRIVPTSNYTTLGQLLRLASSTSIIVLTTTFMLRKISKKRGRRRGRLPPGQLWSQVDATLDCLTYSSSRSRRCRVGSGIIAQWLVDKRPIGAGCRASSHCIEDTGAALRRSSDGGLVDFFTTLEHSSSVLPDGGWFVGDYRELGGWLGVWV